MAARDGGLTGRPVLPGGAAGEWLDAVDGLVAVHLLEEHLGQGPKSVLEIGVWRGAWTSAVLSNVPDARLIGVDPYPDGARTVRDEMLRSIEALGLADRFALVRATDEVDAAERFHLIHIDGDHSEVAAEKDLRFAHRCLHEDGVIIVDDISHKWLPGVASATYRMMEQLDLRMFLKTPAKAYLARRAAASELHPRVRDRLAAHPDVRVAQTYQELTGHPYVEDPSVLGQPVLLVRGRSRPSIRAHQPALLRRIARRIVPGPR